MTHMINRIKNDETLNRMEAFNYDWNLVRWAHSMTINLMKT